MELDQETMDILVQRVAAELSDRLEAMIVALVAPRAEPEHLTVAEVAERLGVARSTVYAHWREWGGFKLSDADKAPIRFTSDVLPAGRSAGRRVAAQMPGALKPRPTPRRRRRRNHLIAVAPRLAGDLTSEA